MNKYIREHIRTLVENKLCCKVEMSTEIQREGYKTMQIKPKYNADITDIYSKLKASTELRQFEITQGADLVMSKLNGQNILFINY